MEEEEEKVEELTTEDEVLDVPTEEVKEEVSEVAQSAPITVVSAEESAKEEEPTVEKKEQPDTKKTKKKGNKVIVVLIVLILLVIGGGVFYYFNYMSKPNETKQTDNKPKEYKSEYRLSGNGLENFDLQFLKLENTAKNKVYSPLSIKYALEMLAEGASGDTKAQLDAVIGDYKARKYNNNEHMSFANAVFIRNSFKDAIKSSYTTNLTNKYNAEVIYDEFANADPMNKWVSDKTFNMINNLFDSDKVKDENFILTNALAIDMNWNNQIQCAAGSTVPCKMYWVHYAHEKVKGSESEFSSSVTPIEDDRNYYPLTFNGKENIKSSKIKASFNNYDAVKEIGEAKIREEVGKAYTEWRKTEGKSLNPDDQYYPEDVNKYLDIYIEELKKNYGKEEFSTDFMLYNDDNVKAFAKDLKEYDGTTLQYVGIMPKNESLDKYIEKASSKDISDIISKLKDMKKENFKDGVVTLIKGYIPLFKYDYDLELMKDLKTLGVKDAFDISKSDLSKMLTSGSKQYIGDVTHKANIEFSNDGIKAAAATQGGGWGSATGGFNYLYEIPVEEINITFDKPFMYLIRDKATGEVWFTGTVYDPIERSEAKDPNAKYDYDTEYSF